MAKVKNAHCAQIFCYTFTERLMIYPGKGELTITQPWRDCSRFLPLLLQLVTGNVH